VTASGIIYGQDLSASTIIGSMRNSNDSSSVSGSFAFSAPTTKPSAGVTSYYWTFTPSDLSNYNSQSGSVSVTTTKATPDVSGIISASDINYGQPLSSSIISGSMRNTNDDFIVNGSFAFANPTTKPSAGSTSYSWTFTPDDPSNYDSQSGSVSVTTTKATPDVSGIISASDINYGQDLSSSTISGSMKNINDGSSVTGSFSFASPTTVPSSGSTSYSWIFTPDDSSNYNSQTNSVDVFTFKVTPDSSSSVSASSITYGQRLSASSISGEHINPYSNAVVTGSYNFRNMNLLLSVGTHSTIWDFNPSDSANYDDISGTVSVTVNKKTPDVSNAVSVSSIEYGQMLGSATLSGSFYNSYSDLAVNGYLGFDLSSNYPTAGNHTYNWTFQPVASVNYNDLSGSIQVTVAKKVPDISQAIVS
jgi:predicted heme/steroid binding protein